MLDLNFKTILIILILIIAAVFIAGNLLKPPQAEYGDKIIEDIGGDGFLNITLDYSLKVKEESIPDGAFNTNEGEIRYFNAKNITYANTFAKQDYFIIWKASPDNYDWVQNKPVNQYISAYLTDGNGKCFVIYSYENKFVYGVMLSNNLKNVSESKFLYDILSLDKNSFNLVYTQPVQQSYGGTSSGSHYHTVVPDRYTLSRTDPGAYYDHYEYGDNYAIDDYLEVEGYD